MKFKVQKENKLYTFELIIWFDAKYLCQLNEVLIQYFKRAASTKHIVFDFN